MLRNEAMFVAMMSAQGVPPGPKKLLINGDFEALGTDPEPFAGWETMTATAEATTTAGEFHSGTRGAKVGGALQQQVSVDGGETYRLTFWAKSDPTGGTPPSVAWQLFPSEPGWTGQALTSDWTQYSFDIVVSAGDNMIEIQIIGRGDEIHGYVDDMALIKL